MEEQLALIDRKVDEGMRLDGQGMVNEAILKYEEAIGFLDVAIRSFSPESLEFEYLKVHKTNLTDRLNVLKNSRDNGFEPDTSLVVQQMALDSKPDTSRTKIAVGAGTVAGVGGLIILGPLGLVAGGVLGAYLTLREGRAGDISRSVGGTAVQAVDTAKETEKKHHILENTKNAVVGAWDATVRVNEKYHVTETIENTAKKVWGSAKEFNEKHDVSGKVATGVSSGMKYVSEKVKNIAK